MYLLVIIHFLNAPYVSINGTSIINVPREKKMASHSFIVSMWTWLKINSAQFKSRSGMIKLVADQFLIRIQFCNTFI